MVHIRVFAENHKYPSAFMSYAISGVISPAGRLVALSHRPTGPLYSQFLVGHVTFSHPVVDLLDIVRGLPYRYFLDVLHASTIFKLEVKEGRLLRSCVRLSTQHALHSLLPFCDGFSGIGE